MKKHSAKLSITEKPTRVFTECPRLLFTKGKTLQDADQKKYQKKMALEPLLAGLEGVELDNVHAFVTLFM